MYAAHHVSQIRHRSLSGTLVSRDRTAPLPTRGRHVARAPHEIDPFLYDQLAVLKSTPAGNRGIAVIGCPT
jgi:hypothetical protein